MGISFMEMARFDESRHPARDFIEMCNASIGINYAQIDDSFGRGMIEANRDGEPHGLYSKDFELWVGEEDSKMLGFVSLVKKGGGSSKIKALIVNPEARGKGVGSTLYQFAMKQLESSGARKVDIFYLETATKQVIYPKKLMMKNLGKNLQMPSYF